jgi:hypothetical protein
MMAPSDQELRGDEPTTSASNPSGIVEESLPLLEETFTGSRTSGE